MRSEDKMESSKNKVRVNIYGEEYTVLAEGDAEYIREIAAFVDRKMRDIAEKTNNKAPSRVAILAALNIADELYMNRRKEEDDITSVQKRTSDIISLLDEKLAHSIE